VAHPTPALWSEAFSWRKIVKFTDLSQEIDWLKKRKIFDLRQANGTLTRQNEPPLQGDIT
jgi:hypothetical protein